MLSQSLTDRSHYPKTAFKSKKSPESNAFRLCYELQLYLSSPSPIKIKAPLTKYLTRLKGILTGKSPLSLQENCKSRIASVFISENLLTSLLNSIKSLDPSICTSLFEIILLVLDPDLKDYIIANNAEITSLLTTEIQSSQLNLLRGEFLRALVQDRDVCKALVNIEIFEYLVNTALSASFDISTVACTSLKHLLIAHGARRFINKYAAEVLKGIYALRDGEYYTKRVALGLLIALLKNRRNKKFIRGYMDDEENVKCNMIIMKDYKSVEVRVQAYQLFATQIEVMAGFSDLNELSAYEIILKNRKKVKKYLKKLKYLSETQQYLSEITKTMDLLDEYFMDTSLQDQE